MACAEEAWNLGADLPTANIFGIALLSLTFIGILVYYNSYRSYLEEFKG